MSEGINIQNIKTFLCVAKLGSFTKAAEELNYTQSTVTAQMQNLDKELGFPLFERIGRKNYLTAGEKEFLTYATEIMQLFQKAGTIVQDLIHAKGIIRIGVLESLLFSNLLQILPKFQQMYPNWEIVIKMGQAFAVTSLLKQNQLDIIYVSNAISADSAIKCYYQCREELVFVASQKHPLATNRENAMHEIFSYPFVPTEPAGYCFGRLREIVSEQNLKLHHSITIDSVTAIVSLLKDDRNVAFLPKYAIREQLHDGTLATLHTALPPQFYYSQLLCSREKWLSPFVESLIPYIRKTYPETTLSGE